MVTLQSLARHQHELSSLMVVFPSPLEGSDIAQQHASTTGGNTVRNKSLQVLPKAIQAARVNQQCSPAALVFNTLTHTNRTSFHKRDVTRLAAMHDARWQMFPQTGCYQVGSDGSNSIAQASTNRMLPGWQRCMRLDGRCFHKPDVTRLAAMD